MQAYVYADDKTQSVAAGVCEDPVAFLTEKFGRPPKAERLGTREVKPYENPEKVLQALVTEIETVMAVSGAPFRRVV